MFIEATRAGRDTQRFTTDQHRGGCQTVGYVYLRHTCRFAGCRAGVPGRRSSLHEELNNQGETSLNSLIKPLPLFPSKPASCDDAKRYADEALAKAREDQERA